MNSTDSRKKWFPGPGTTSVFEASKLVAKRRNVSRLRQKEVVPKPSGTTSVAKTSRFWKWFPQIPGTTSRRSLASKQAISHTSPKWFPTGSQLVPGTGLGSGSRSGSRGAPLRGAPPREASTFGSPTTSWAGTGSEVKHDLLHRSHRDRAGEDRKGSRCGQAAKDMQAVFKGAPQTGGDALRPRGVKRESRRFNGSGIVTGEAVSDGTKE